MAYPTTAPGLRLTYDWSYLDAFGQIRRIEDDVQSTLAGSGADTKVTTLAAAAEATLWDAAVSPVTDFTSVIFVAKLSSFEVEFTVKEGDAAEVIFVLTIVPGQMPTMLGSSLSRYNIGADGFAGTGNPIDKIRAKNIGAPTGTLLMHLVN